MTDSANEDSVTKLNTQLNKSMVLMENAGWKMEDTPTKKRKRRTITINTEEQPPSAFNSPVVKKRRSILKKIDNSFSIDLVKKEDIKINGNIEELNNTLPQKLSLPVLSKPQTLNELVEKEALVTENVSSTFNLEDISDSEDIWIMNIPRIMDLQDFCGQTITLDDKAKLKIKNERYYTLTHNIDCNVTCIFNTGKKISQYKTVNIKPAGLLSIRRKLPAVPEVESGVVQNCDTPFPKNLQTRHPMYGIIHKRLSCKKKSKKLKEKEIQRFIKIET